MSRRDEEATTSSEDSWLSGYFDNLNTELFFNLIKEFDFGFQGFDPRELLKSLWATAKRRQITKEQFQKDMFFLSIVGTVRGSKTGKIAKSSSEAMAQELNKLVTTYGVMNSGKNSQAPTLPRIAALHARQISEAIHKEKIVGTINPNHPDLPMGFPLGLCSSTAGSLIPKPGKLDDLAMEIFPKSWLYHQYLFARVINPKSKPNCNEISSYGLIQMESTIYSDEKREEHWVKLKVLTPKGNVLAINDIYRIPLETAAELWDKIK